MPRLSSPQLLWRAAASACVLASTSANSQKAVDIHLIGPPTPELVRAVAKVGKPTTITLDAANDVRDVVAAHCGGVDPVYLELLVGSNPGLSKSGDRLAAGTKLRLPACVRTQIASVHVIRPGETVGGIYAKRGFPLDTRGLQSETASTSAGSALFRALELSRKGMLQSNSGYKGFIARENALSFELANKKQDFVHQQPGDALIVPLAPESITFATKDGMTVAEAVAEISSAIKSSGLAARGRVSQARAAQLISEVTLPRGRCDLDATNWPISQDGLMAAVAENAAARPANTTPGQGRVLVLDTGIEDLGLWAPAIPSSNLAKMLGFNVRSGAPLYYGVNLAAERNDAVPPESLPDRLHGGEVASALLGGGQLPTGVKTSLPVLISFASISAEDADGIPFLSATAVARAFQQAKANHIPIVNASIDAVEDRDAFQRALLLAGEDVLFVVAAGNDGTTFSPANSTWPGSFGGAAANGLGGLVVTVGAHDMEGRISPFSRKGAEEVDLLAPGCAVSTYTREGTPGATLQTTPRDGTSFAAPLVSLVSALLYSEGLAPVDIKRRLLVSVDVDEALSSTVYSAGRLNLRKALSVWRDYVDYGSGDARRVRTGSLADRNAVITVCKRSFALKDLMKLSRASNSDVPASPLQAHLWLTSSSPELGAAMKHASCDATQIKPAFISFRDATSGELIRLSTSDINDLVTRAMDPTN